MLACLLIPLAALLFVFILARDQSTLEGVYRAPSEWALPAASVTGLLAAVLLLENEARAFEGPIQRMMYPPFEQAGAMERVFINLAVNLLAVIWVFYAVYRPSVPRPSGLVTALLALAVCALGLLTGYTGVLHRYPTPLLAYFPGLPFSWGHITEGVFAPRFTAWVLNALFWWNGAMLLSAALACLPGYRQARAVRWLEKLHWAGAPLFGVALLAAAAAVWPAPPVEIRRPALIFHPTPAARYPYPAPVEASATPLETPGAVTPAPTWTGYP